jgi:20S proteasome alpha/beta subunit
MWCSHCEVYFATYWDYRDHMRSDEGVQAAVSAIYAEIDRQESEDAQLQERLLAIVTQKAEYKERELA